MHHFALLARFHGVSVDVDQLRHQFAPGIKPFGPQEVAVAANSYGLRVRRRAHRSGDPINFPLPAIGFDDDGNSVLLLKSSSDAVLVQLDPGSMPESRTAESLAEIWNGDVLLFSKRDTVLGQRPFGFSWFIPSLTRYRKLLGEVVVASLVLQLLGLVTPLFFQVVMDKVLSHGAVTTLTILVIGLIACNIFESLITVLRSYVFSHTTSRVDVDLGARLYRHLVALPLAYFQARRVGDSVARVRELENIRSFLTGNAITVCMDAVFTVVFVAVMLLYSPKLTLVVILSIPIYVGISVLVTPLLRVRIREKFDRGAENQSFLVESVSAAHTIKAMAVEEIFSARWEEQLARYVRVSFRAGNLSTVARESVGLVSKLTSAAILWFGAKLVMADELTLGQLIAFNMLAGRVSQPVLRLAQLWSDFQQVGMSMRRLADVLDTPSERPISVKPILAPVTGSVELQDVSCRYPSGQDDVLCSINLSIAPGEIVGIVGPSGSGKSTLAAVLQRLLVPRSGRVLVDGVDIATVDVTSLRRQLGVVLQDNVLFHGTIRDNIALAVPGAPFGDVVRVAKLAGAHDFIQALPAGYDTLVGEHGASLSGGQRQRVAIARTLISDPKILIFDEATSALDLESEQVLQTHMADVCKGRTVIIIAHRLSALRSATRVVALEQGRIIEDGSPAALLGTPQSLYGRLHRLQEA